MTVKTILVVEDDRSLARLAQLNLEAQGHVVVVCNEGVQAMAYLNRCCPDLILLDLMLPSVSGWDLLEHLRSDGRLGGIPVVVVSALARPEDRARAEALGAREYVIKPFGIRQLVDTVEHLVEDRG